MHIKAGTDTGRALGSIVGGNLASFTAELGGKVIWRRAADYLLLTDDGPGPNHSFRRCRRSFSRERGGFCLIHRFWADMCFRNPLACAVRCLQYIRFSAPGKSEGHYKANG
jgi:hypothetical protein